MKSLKTLAISGIIVCSMSAVALAVPPMAKDSSSNKVVSNYTDAQRDQYEKLYADYKNKTMPMHESMMAKMMEFNDKIRTEQKNFNSELSKAGLPQHGGFHRGMGMMSGDAINCPGMSKDKMNDGHRGKGYGQGHGYGRMGNMY